MKITQSPSISVAALRKLAEGGDHIHIHMTNVVNASSHSEIPEWMDGVSALDEQGLYQFILELPEPRLDNLISLVYILALKYAGGKKSQAAKILGTSLRNFYNRKEYVTEGVPDRYGKQKLLAEKLAGNE